MKYVKNGTINKKLTYRLFFSVYSSGSKIFYMVHRYLSTKRNLTIASKVYECSYSSHTYMVFFQKPHLVKQVLFAIPLLCTDEIDEATVYLLSY